MNIIESYLVSLGFEPDEQSFHRFSTVMSEAERLVTEHSTGMAKRVVEAQFAITGAFTSIAAAILGVVDRVSMADQSYRLLGLRMFMTTDQARKMEMVTKTLGASLGEIFWDPELRARAALLLGDMARFNKALGPDFEEKMRGWRDIRAEFGRLSIAAQYLGMSFSEKLYDKLGGGDLEKTLHDFVDNISPEKISHWADVLSDKAIPVLKETWQILIELKNVAKEGVVAFTNLVGAFTGDTSISGTTADFEKFAKTLEHVENGFVDVLHYITDAEKALAHFASGFALIEMHKWSDAAKEFKEGAIDLGKIQGGLLLAPGGGMLMGPYKERNDNAPESPLPPTTPSRQALNAISPGELFLPPVSTSHNPPVPTGENLNVAPLHQALKDIWSHHWWKGIKQLPGSMWDFVSKPASPESDEHYFLRHPDIYAPPITQQAAGVNGTDSSSTSQGTQFRSPRELQQELSDDSKTLRLESLFELQRQLSDDSKTLRLESLSASIGKEAAGFRSYPETSFKTDDIARLVAASARYHEVPQELALAVAKHESGFREVDETGKTLLGPTTKTGEHAMGVMQLMPETAKTLGVDAENTLQNIDGGVRYLGQLLQRYGGDQTRALAAYNTGPGRIPVDKSLDLSTLPQETRDYIPTVLGLEQQFQWIERVQNPQLPESKDLRSRTIPRDSAPDLKTRVFASSDSPSSNSSADSLGSSFNDALLGYLQRAQSQPSYSTHTEQTLQVNVGGITISTGQGGNVVDPHVIERRVRDGIRDAFRNQIQWDLLQTSPTY